MTHLNINDYPNAKKAFEAWYLQNVEIKIGNIENLSKTIKFYLLPLSMQFGVFVEFAIHELGKEDAEYLFNEIIEESNFVTAGWCFVVCCFKQINEAYEY